jgi:hypothetical protein
MSILHSLSSNTGDKTANQRVAQQCMERPVLLHSIAEGLRTGNNHEQLDCALILVELSKKHPDHLIRFSSDFIKMIRSNSKRLVRLGLAGLFNITSKVAAEIYAEKELLVSLTEPYGPIALDATALIARLSAQNAMYRGQLSFEILKILARVPEEDLVKWLKKTTPAFLGSSDLIKKLHQMVSDRRDILESTKPAINIIFSRKLKSRLSIS